MAEPQMTITETIDWVEQQMQDRATCLRSRLLFLDESEEEELQTLEAAGY